MAATKNLSTTTASVVPASLSGKYIPASVVRKSALLVGSNVPFFGGVVTNIMGMVGDLGKNGLVGLIALAIIMWLFSHRKVA